MHLGSAFVSLATLVTAVSIAACSVTNNTPAEPSAAHDDGGSSGDPAASGDGGPSSDGANPTTNPPPSQTEAPVAIDGTCKAFAACGGNPQGTFDYTAGCVADTFNAAKAQCPTLDTSNAKVNVTGSLYFAADALNRDAVVKVSGSIVVPAACSAGQCAVVESALKTSFDSVTCTGSTACTCTIAKTTIVKNATTFAVAGNTVTTGDGESYQICAQSNSLRYTGKSLGSEDGDWELVKRP